MNTSANFALRVDRANPDHHLWNNNGTWWCHFTVHLPDFTKRRIRRSLQTGSRFVARLRRDALFSTHNPAN
jgi:hypothetical protein